MFGRTNLFQIVVPLLLGLSVLVGSSTVCKAAPIVINFDAVDTSSPPALGVDPTAYLAGFGVTLTNVTPGTGVGIKNPATFDPNLILLSNPNYMSQWWGGINGVSYDMMFSQPLLDLSISIPQITPGVSVPAWSFTALDAGGSTLTTSFSQGLSGAAPRRTFNFLSSNDPGLQGVRIFSNVMGVAGMGGIPIDDVAFTTPEPSALLMLMTAGLGLICYRVRRRQQA